MCPQKKNIGNIRFTLYLTHIISTYNQEEIDSLKNFLGITIKPNEVADFFGLGLYAVRKMMGEDVEWLDDARWLSKHGKIERCFKSVSYIRYKGYFLQLEEEFLDEILKHLEEAKSIDSVKFGEINSVYSLVLYGCIISSQEGLVSLSMEGLKSIFGLEDRYPNSNMLYKKCIKQPCDKINNIFKTNFISKKIPLGVGDFIWIIGKEDAVSNVTF